eukprot:jgi/Chlat1/2525/Chrsp175S02381
MGTLRGGAAPSFQLHLGAAIDRGSVCVGLFDGVRPSLAAATTGGRVLVHSPHRAGTGTDEDGATGGAALPDGISYLNMQRPVTALAAGAMTSTTTDVGGGKKELLLVGAAQGLLAYDVVRNTDAFYVEVPDGVRALVHGRPEGSKRPLAIAGGRCTIAGFDGGGTERLWTVTGDDVTCMALADVDGSGSGEEQLLVGSADRDIRAFRGEEVVAEVAEAAPATALCGIRGVGAPRWAYALEDGAVGLYEGTNRAWRVRRGRHTAAAITTFDADGDGVPEVIVAWTGGRLEARSQRDGTLVAHMADDFADAAALLRADYRLEGRESLLCCSTRGELRAYPPAAPNRAVVAASTSAVEDREAAFAELAQRKQELLYELQSFENSARTGVPEALAPVQAQVTVSLSRTAGCELVVQAGGAGASIRGAIVTAEGLFEKGNCMSFPRSSGPELRIPLNPPADISAELQIQVFVGADSGSVYEVMDLQLKLPKFAMYSPLKDGQAPQSPGVTLLCRERASRVAAWVATAFGVPEPQAQPGERVVASFMSLRDKRLVTVSSTPDSIAIQTADIALAGDLVQDLAAYAARAGSTWAASSAMSSAVEVRAEFPQVAAHLCAAASRAEEARMGRLAQQAEQAARAAALKSLLLRAEDARQLVDVPLLRGACAHVAGLHRDGLLGHAKADVLHRELIDALKELNQLIQRAARLRVGEAQIKIVAACRNAVKANNLQALARLAQLGDVASAR